MLVKITILVAVVLNTSAVMLVACGGTNWCTGDGKQIRLCLAAAYNFLVRATTMKNA